MCYDKGSNIYIFSGNIRFIKRSVAWITCNAERKTYYYRLADLHFLKADDVFWKADSVFQKVDLVFQMADCACSKIYLVFQMADFAFQKAD